MRCCQTLLSFVFQLVELGSDHLMMHCLHAPSLAVFKARLDASLSNLVW